MRVKLSRGQTLNLIVKIKGCSAGLPSGGLPSGGDEVREGSEQGARQRRNQTPVKQVPQNLNLNGTGLNVTKCEVIFRGARS